LVTKKEFYGNEEKALRKSKRQTRKLKSKDRPAYEDPELTKTEKVKFWDK